TAHIPQIKLLHPNLYRVRVALRTLQAEKVTIGGALGTLDDLDALLAELSHQETPFLPELAEGFFNVTQLQEKLWGQLGSIASQTG
ncbi:MAG TPA: hypothetical protein PLZ51_04060, partial [Aggregatilineales bacterium]|nr:hypothetical protein [Aggregatilineales bacterium]